MSDAATHAVPAADRGAWLRNLRRVNEQQEDALAGDFDPNWGEIEPTHQAFVERFLSRLPPAGRVLDAACGTGKYFPMVLASGRGLLGVDHAGAYLAVAATKFPQVPHRQVRSPGAPLPGRVRRGAVRGRHGVPPTRGLATGPGALPPRPAPRGLVVLDGRARPRRSGAGGQSGGPPGGSSGGGRRGHLGVARRLLPSLPEHGAGPSLACRCRIHPR